MLGMAGRVVGMLGMAGRVVGMLGITGRVVGRAPKLPGSEGRVVGPTPPGLRSEELHREQLRVSGEAGRQAHALQRRRPTAAADGGAAAFPSVETGRQAASCKQETRHRPTRKQPQMPSRPPAAGRT
jgi:hypothetical protein